MENIEGWLRLAAIPGLGGESQRKLLSAFGLPEQIFAASHSNLKAVIGDKASCFLQAPNSKLIEQALNWLAQPDNGLIALDDQRYPPQLLNIPDPPTLLFVRGNPNLLRANALAIVGSRHASQSGKDTARAFAQAIGHTGTAIISGLASGIDAAAHEGAVHTVGGTVAVIGTGPDRLYPASNRQLAERILEKGCIVSEYFPGTPALPGNFPRRNRIIAGLARGVLVVEAALESGSLITARLALENGREVMAVPGSIHSPMAKGCHRLIKQGAKLVETAEDILEEIGIAAATMRQNPAPTQAELPAKLKPILECIQWEPTGFDQIVEQSGLGTSELLAALLELEMHDWIAVTPGDLYQRLR